MVLQKKKKAIVLLSGGIDSATTLFLAKDKGYAVEALIFNYGQKHKKEIKFAKKLASLAKSPYYCLKIELPWLQSSLTCPRREIPKSKSLKIPSTYVAGRNIIFLSYAASYAESVKAKAIFIGAHTLDYSGYPDCRRDFLLKFNKALNTGIAMDKIDIFYPLINKNKKEIIELGLSLGVPFEHTWSCYQGKSAPCLRCDSCRFRINAFSLLGTKDPLLKKNAHCPNK